MITTLFADQHGEIFDQPGKAAVGRSGDRLVPLSRENMIPLPEGAELMFLPGRRAVAWEQGEAKALTNKGLAVAAMLPVGYTRTLLPAFIKGEDAPVLPLYGYTAAALIDDEIYVAAVKSDDNAKWHPYAYNTPKLKGKVRRLTEQFPKNRLVEHLGNCSLSWHCCTAQNLFYHRWEAGIPTSPVCNANCFGCISLQPSECCPSPQTRIAFTPTPEEVAEIGAYHLATAEDGIISFGQGCEGEPSLAYETIAAAMQQIRAVTDQGILNINTNAGFTTGIKAIVDAGLNSMRVSINSPTDAVYQAYYRAGYDLAAVKESIRYAKSKGVFVSLNMLFFPGINDCESEVAAWESFIKELAIDMIQLRNLNVDPDELMTIMPKMTSAAMGVKPMIARLQQAAPSLVIGSFSHYNKEE
ncbi:MAG: radical SAM protein [Sporomusaceae bacterium]|nr:radical SAM protein [Sporomusaceae bacterium]